MDAAHMVTLTVRIEARLVSKLVTLTFPKFPSNARSHVRQHIYVISAGLFQIQI